MAVLNPVVSVPVTQPRCLYLCLCLHTKRRKLITYHHDILIDPRTSCTRDGAVAILLGRSSFDPIYENHNPQDDPVKVREQFMEWLDLSIFTELVDERDGLLSKLEDAREGNNTGNNTGEITACRARIVQCDNTIQRAKLILCDIDDELAKGALSKLRLDSVIRETSSEVHITLSSLKNWAKDRDYQTMSLEASPTQAAPESRNSPESDEPLLDPDGGMSATAARSFLVTFAVLLEEFVLATGKKFIAENGTGIVEERIAKHLSSKSSSGTGSRSFLYGQGVSVIETRVKSVISEASNAAVKIRARKIKKN